MITFWSSYVPLGAESVFYRCWKVHQDEPFWYITKSWLTFEGSVGPVCEGGPPTINQEESINPQRGLSWWGTLLLWFQTDVAVTHPRLVIYNNPSSTFPFDWMFCCLCDVLNGSDTGSPWNQRIIQSLFPLWIYAVFTWAVHGSAPSMSFNTPVFWLWGVPTWNVSVSVSGNEV